VRYRAELGEQEAWEVRALLAGRRQRVSAGLV
jgi:hypothetical protein